MYDHWKKTDLPSNVLDLESFNNDQQFSLVTFNNKFSGVLIKTLNYLNTF